MVGFLMHWKCAIVGAVGKVFLDSTSEFVNGAFMLIGSFDASEKVNERRVINISRLNTKHQIIFIGFSPLPCWSGEGATAFVFAIIESCGWQ